MSCTCVCSHTRALAHTHTRPPTPPPHRTHPTHHIHAHTHTRTHTGVRACSLASHLSSPALSPRFPFIPVRKPDPGLKYHQLQSLRKLLALERITLLVLGWPAWPLMWAGDQIYSSFSWGLLYPYTAGLYIMLGLYFGGRHVQLTAVVTAGLAALPLIALIGKEDLAQREKDVAELRSGRKSAAELKD